MSSSTDFKELFFEYKILPEIEGEPAFNYLHYLLQLIKANACSVPCTLGGENHGYVGILLSDAAYSILDPGTPFIAPVHPRTLTIIPGATQYQIDLAKTQYNEATRVFREYSLMKRALIQQVVTLINKKYLSSMRNRVTG